MSESTKQPPPWSDVAKAALEIARLYPNDPLARRMVGSEGNDKALRDAVFAAVVKDEDFVRELQERLGWP